MTAAHGHVYFVSGGRIYRQPLASGGAAPLTPAFGDAASPCLSPDGRWVLYVHTYEGHDCLAVADVSGREWPQKLVEGDDFYMQPAWHPGCDRVAWVSWNHPLMPWDGTRLGLATLSGNGGGSPRVSHLEVIAGDEETAIFQPEFSPDGRYLAYISDANAWSRLCLYDLGTLQHRVLVDVEAELAVAAWRQGMRTFAWSPGGESIYYIQAENGHAQLWTVQVDAGTRTLCVGLSEYADLSKIAVSSKGQVAMIASGPRTPTCVISYCPDRSQVRTWARSGPETVAAEQLSTPLPISWQSQERDPVHGLYYAPRATDASAAGKPPLIVHVHGGPTGQSTARHAPDLQFFTTRGYAVLDVNYRGSYGYGRAYRRLLDGQWGIYDVDDAVTGARHLAEKGLVDPSKMVIMGGSAGGYAVLQALVRYPGTFAAGLCLYGVTNLFTLASDTHKFEQHYLDTIVGPLPETAARYRERSPVFAASRIIDPVAIFQGEDDRVVPVAQAETIISALARNGVPHEYHLYPGEGHGWRKSETIVAFYAAVLAFLKRHVLFA